MAERKNRRPRLLIIGHARHGKDTVAEMISELMGLKFISSSKFVGEECIWPMWGKERYESFDAMFADRVNYRSTWKDLILAYNTPDRARTARTMLERGYDLYVGMRSAEEFAVARPLFDKVIWVARPGVPDEGSDSMELDGTKADIFIHNHGTLDDLMVNYIVKLQKLLHEEGFDVNYTSPEAKTVNTVLAEAALSDAEARAAEIKAWTEAPEGAMKLLDHGFIQFKEAMGSDHEIAESARMSYGRGTKKVKDDAGLLKYLLLNHHTSPFEMAEIKVHMRMPIFVMRQWVRHRTANLNEYSGRYSEMPRLFYIPELEQIRGQHAVNKQGSGEKLSVQQAKMIQSTMLAVSNEAFDKYELMLGAGLSRETARIILPLNTYTEVVWKIDLNNLIKTLRLRDDSHAQWEIQQYAQALSKIFEEKFPLTYEVYLQMRQMLNLTWDELLAIATNSPDNPDWGLGKGQKDKVNTILKELFGRIEKPKSRSKRA